MKFLLKIGGFVCIAFKNLPKNALNFGKFLLLKLKKFGVFLKNTNNAQRSAALLIFSVGFVLFTVLFSVKKIIITDENSIHVVYSMTSDPEKVLPVFGYSLSEHDEVKKVIIGDEVNLAIKRAFPVSITADGETKTVYMTEGTVREALKLADISYSEEDLLSISPDEFLEGEASLSVRRVTYSTDVLEETIPYEINQRQTPLITRVGRVVVLEAGQNGTKEVTVQRRLIDGEEVERTVIGTRVTKSPVTQVSLVGAKKGTPASSLSLPAGITITASGAPSSYSSVYEGRATAYSAKSGAKGYSGKTLHLGSVAVNPSLIPMGSIVYVTSTDGSFVYGVAIALDSGKAVVQGNAVADCFFPTYDESCWFGAKRVKVYVIGKAF